MEKELSQMTLEELWQLFPIYLVPPNEKWSEYYIEMKIFLKGALSDSVYKRISHIGSTAIKGIWAKNIVDVLIEIYNDKNIENVAEVLESIGFIRMSTQNRRISFNKGYTKKGFAEKVYHIHLRYTGDNDELYFRDYLNDFPHLAKKYEALKLKLWKMYEHDRDAYTEAKTGFVSKYTSKARLFYGDRY